MVKVTCKHSGIEFEAKTARTKQHPQIADAKASANKRGNYRMVNDALDAVKSNGGYTTIDEYMSMVHDIVAGKTNRRAEIAAKRRQDAENSKAKRAADTQKIKNAGYELRTVVETRNDDGQGEYDLVDVRHWFSPDGRQVSRTQALDEVERGASVVQAEIAERIAEEEKRVAEQKAEDEAKAARKDKQITEFDAEKVRIINRGIKATISSAQNNSAEWLTVKSIDGLGYRYRDTIKRAIIGGAMVYRIVEGTGYDDDGFSSYYYTDGYTLEISG